MYITGLSQTVGIVRSNLGTTFAHIFCTALAMHAYSSPLRGTTCNYVPQVVTITHVSVGGPPRNMESKKHSQLGLALIFYWCEGAKKVQKSAKKA